MKKVIIPMFLIFILARLGFAQSVSPDVIASSGEHFTAANTQLSWTIGELMIETYTAGNNQLTQGFHQTKLSAVGIEDLDESIVFNVFPNPTTQQLNLEIGQGKVDYTVRLFDVNGKMMYSELISNSGIKNIDVTKYGAGTYFLYLININHQPIKTIKIIKSK